MAVSDGSSVVSRKDSAPPTPPAPPRRRWRRLSRPAGLPSPALCCACGLCVLLAGLNITLVGAFAFGSVVASSNPPIIIGPVLLLVAFTFFAACCVCSRLPPLPRSHGSNAAGGRGCGGGGLMGGAGGLAGGATFEIETSEHTLQDTTAVQLSPASSLASSRGGSSPQREETAAPSQPLPSDSNGPACISALYSAAATAGGEVKLNLPREEGMT